jgi:uncharacterized protein (DUF2062 family)
MDLFKDKFRTIFKVKDTPHRIALAFAIGVFLGISPFLGLHYIGGFAIAWLVGLNKLVTLVGVSVNNPWTIVPISSFCVWIGAKLIGIKQILPEVEWESITLMNILGKFSDFHNFIEMVKQLWPLIASFFVGSLLIGSISAVASYFIIQIIMARYKKAEDAT